MVESPLKPHPAAGRQHIRTNNLRAGAARGCTAAPLSTEESACYQRTHAVHVILERYGPSAERALRPVHESTPSVNAPYPLPPLLPHCTDSVKGCAW